MIRDTMWIALQRAKYVFAFSTDNSSQILKQGKIWHSWINKEVTSPFHSMSDVCVNIYGTRVCMW